MKRGLLPFVGPALLLLVLLLTGCANRTDSFQGIIESVEEGSFIVGCSDEINKGKKNVNDIGYLCAVNYTDETKWLDPAGNELAMEDFIKGSEVKVILSKKVQFNQDYGELPAAKEMILIKQFVYIEPYDFRRDEVLKATIYKGGIISGSAAEVVAEINSDERLNELSDIFQGSDAFTGNSTSDLNYTNTQPQIKS